MTEEEAIKAINAADDAVAAAEIGFRAIAEFGNIEMGDGDGARAVADAWIAKWVRTA